MSTEDIHDMNSDYICMKGLNAKNANQDDFSIALQNNFKLLGIFDGHGPNGHIISTYASRRIMQLIASDNYFYADTSLAMRNCFIECHKTLSELPDELGDANTSGTCALVTAVMGRRIYTACTGNSRCVLGYRRRGMTKFCHVDLSNDHNLSNKAERLRVESSGGVVFKIPGDERERLFVHERCYPGITVTRSIGNFQASHCGVIADPEISVHELDDNIDTAFVVLASDGLWDFVSSARAVDILSSSLDVKSGTSALVQEALSVWNNSVRDQIDDITVIVSFIDFNLII